MRRKRILVQSRSTYVKYYPQIQYRIFWIPVWLYYSSGSAYEWFWDEDDAREFIKQQEIKSEKAQIDYIYL